MISLICPTRSRPDKLKRMWQSALKTAVYPEKLFLHMGIDQDEVPLYSAVGLKEQYKAYIMQDWGVVHSINMMSIEALKSDARLFMIACDDTIFATPGWDEALINHYNALENKIHVYSMRDSRDPDGTPHPVLTREYITAMGYLYPPLFLHWYVDSWTAEIAKSCGVFTHLKDFELIHDKPSDYGQLDSTYKRVRNRGWNTRDGYVNEKCRHFLEEEKDRLWKTIQHQSGAREHLE